MPITEERTVTGRVVPVAKFSITRDTSTFMPLDVKQHLDLKTLEAYLTGPNRKFLEPMKPGESPFLDLLARRVMIFDGAMGTQIFTFNLSLKDFWDKENCVDVLVLSRPDVIEEIHTRYS